MNFLIIVQDLRVSGTSQGIIERSFLFKLKKVYPEANIEVLYVSGNQSNDQLGILPVQLTKIVISNKVPFQIKWFNRIYRRLFKRSYADQYLINKYTKAIDKHLISNKINTYDLIMVRSSGLNHETIRALQKSFLLPHATINFHDPYPYIWYKADFSKASNEEFHRLNIMMSIVNRAKVCCSSAYYMSQDLKYLYADNKPYHVVPHQFAPEAFDFSDTSQIRPKQRKIQMSYHGALMFGRNLDALIDAFINLSKEYPWVAQDVELILRIKGEGVSKIKEKVKEINNIAVLDCLDFSNSSMEQINQSDVVIILENGPDYCNILPGKTPFLFSFNKKVLISSPKRSELRTIAKNNYPYMYEIDNLIDAKNKILSLLQVSNPENEVFVNYFSDENFKKALDSILNKS